MTKLTAIVHPGEVDEGGFWATGLEVPGANGQGETKEECLTDLSAAVRVPLETERQQQRKDDPAAEEITMAI